MQKAVHMTVFERLVQISKVSESVEKSYSIQTASNLDEMPTHLQHTAIAKSHRYRKQALKVLKAFEISRLDRISKLEVLIKNLQRLRLRCTFISLQKLPHLVYRIADRVANRNL